MSVDTSEQLAELKRLNKRLEHTQRRIKRLSKSNHRKVEGSSNHQRELETIERMCTREKGLRKHIDIIQQQLNESVR